MMFPVFRNESYDFSDQNYADSYPNLHKYPATMLPQIGIKLLQEFCPTGKTLYDPYCGSGSSFAAGLECGFSEMYGYDLNPLAVLISNAKYTYIEPQLLEDKLHWLYYELDNIHIGNNGYLLEPRGEIQLHNREYWFSSKVMSDLTLLNSLICQIDDVNVRQLFSVAFSETMRHCSYTRNGEFKLYRISAKDLADFKVDVFHTFRSKLATLVQTYTRHYQPKLKNSHIHISNTYTFLVENKYDVVLTSPPYGDSRTTVAYGQFSRFTNEWLGIEEARKIDAVLMGGKKAKNIYNQGVMQEYIETISSISVQRALEVSSFYVDLEKSIQNVAQTIKHGGKAIYIVGNRLVKGVQLPTDQFIAEKFVEVGFKHIITYERLIGNKVMPGENSPSNIAGNKSSTMTQEFIVICEKG
jgi:hypothetical protein